MTANSTVKPPVAERLTEILGPHNLALILEAYELIRCKSGHGEIKLVIYDGKITGVWETTKLR